MPSAAALRIQIERFLENRFPAALTPTPRGPREVASTGIENVDAFLNGGLPVGAISEIVGAASSGRTSLAMVFLSQRTAEGRVCAWVDVNDRLDPESAAANGIALPQLLWIRCRDASQRTSSGKQDVSVHDFPAVTVSERHDVSGHDFSRAEKAQKNEGALAPEGSPNQRKKSRPWSRLDQALRATDLLLQAGGFAAIVLDLGDTAREHASRIPLATWFRYRQAADRTRCSLVVLGQAAYAQSSAAVVLECAPLRPLTAGDTVLRGFSAEVRRGRERFAPVEIGTRKPPASAWSADAQWQRQQEKHA